MLLAKHGGIKEGKRERERERQTHRERERKRETNNPNCKRFGAKSRAISSKDGTPSKKWDDNLSVFSRIYLPNCCCQWAQEAAPSAWV